jgi:Ca-activated chloride channel family protein
MNRRRTSKPTTVIILSWALAASLLMPGLAQQPPQPPSRPTGQQKKDDQKKKAPQRQGAEADQGKDLDNDSTIKIPTELVLLDVTVIDQNNRPVFTLTKDDFTVYEDKVKQEIENVSREEVPISVGLVIDTSGSMRTKLQTVSDAALGLVRQLRPHDEAFIAQFKAEPELVQDFTQDKRELEDALGELFTGGGTSLLDAIIATADYAHEKGKQRRKALVIITDGLEKNSSVKEKEVMDAIKEDLVQVYLVGFIDEAEDAAGIFGKSPAKKAKELLNRLAEDSGGRAFFPKDVSEMAAIAKQIAEDLRTQYVISYYPSNANRDGAFRSVRVVINPKDSRKLIARTRQGYYARNDKGAAQTANDKKLRNNPPPQ